MSEYFRKLIKRDPPPAANIRFRCAKLHGVTDAAGNSKDSEYNTIYDVLKSRGWKETDVDTEWHIFWCDKDAFGSASACEPLPEPPRADSKRSAGKEHEKDAAAM